jgi:predicted permease
MALALVLLVGAGLMIRSLSALWNVDPGFRADNVLTFSISLPPSMQDAKPEAIDASWRELSTNLNAMPDVRAASFSTGAIPILGEDDRWFWIEGEPKPASTSDMHMALIYQVEPTYLPAMDIPLKQGRFFTAQDDERAPNVVVVDEVLARQYFPREDPVGKHIYMGDNFQAEIVGVVGHVMQWGLDGDKKESLQAQLYQPFKQASSGTTGVGVVMRVEGAAMQTGTALFDSIRQVVQSQHSQNVIFQPQTMNEVIAKSLAAQRFVMILLNAFAVVALLLASIGLYGVNSYLVGQRTHELGIRLALGAKRRDILQLILRHGMKMALGGVVLGLIGALCLTQLLTEMLFGVSATDPATFAVIALILTAVALLASYLPARRATRVDPLVALRHE